MSLHIQFNCIVRKEPNKQLKQEINRVHLAEDDERPPNRLDFAPPPPKRSTIAFKPLWDSK